MEERDVELAGNGHMHLDFVGLGQQTQGCFKSNGETQPAVGQLNVIKPTL